MGETGQNARGFLQQLLDIVSRATEALVDFADQLVGKQRRRQLPSHEEGVTGRARYPPRRRMLAHQQTEGFELGQRAPNAGARPGNAARATDGLRAYRLRGVSVQ